MNTPTADRFISVVGSYTIHPDDAAAFANIARESVATTRGKQGCLYYVASQDLVQPNVFHLAEGWASQSDLDAHGASTDFKHMLEQAFKLRIENREIYVSASTGRTLMR